MAIDLSLDRLFGIGPDYRSPAIRARQEYGSRVMRGQVPYFQGEPGPGYGNHPWDDPAIQRDLLNLPEPPYEPNLPVPGVPAQGGMPSPTAPFAPGKPGYLQMLEAGSPDEQANAIRIKRAMEEFDAQQKAAEQEKLARLAGLTESPLPPGARMNSGSPMVDARLALAERNAANMRGRIPPDYTQQTAENLDRDLAFHGATGRMPASVPGLDRNGQPQRSTYVPPREEVTTGLPPRSRLNNGIGGLTVLPSRTIRKPGEEEMYQRRQIAQTERQAELDARKATRAGYYDRLHNQQSMQNYLGMLMGVDPRLAQTLVNAEIETAKNNSAQAQYEQELEIKKQLALANLAEALGGVPDGTTPQDFLSQLQGGGVPSGSPTGIPTQSQIDKSVQAGANLSSSDVAAAVLDQMPTVPTDPQALRAAGWTPESALSLYKDMTSYAAPPTPAGKALWDARAEKIRRIYQTLTGSELPAVPQSVDMRWYNPFASVGNAVGGLFTGRDNAMGELRQSLFGP